MSTQDIRRKFLDYFSEQEHAVVPSSSVVPHDDPTLLFCNAGMNPFKDVFLGKSVRSYKRATSSQKCIRVGGKHNDLENVGHTTRHITFFEMLGNFSFGDYFKKEAIDFAWEVTNEVFGLDPERVFVSVFRDDDEAYELWKKHVPEKRLVRLDERDNFWTMGDTGPCGPCSELLYDRGAKYGDAPSPYEDTEGERFLEFWNLVFMQHNRDADGKMHPLPNKSVDTGAGLERIVALQMGVNSVFETDVLRHLIGKVEELSGVKYTEGAAPFQVIADHFRMLAFAIADGAQPGNVERGYVLRKVLRRAVRYGRQLELNEPFMAKLMTPLLEKMGDDYSELKAARGRIEELVTLEEEAFLRTLKRGGNLLGQVMERSKEHISGDDAFTLKDTYGLPIEEILLIAKDADLTVDLDRYQALEEEARLRSKKVHKATQQVAEESAFAGLQSEFCGYAATSGEGQVIALFADGKKVDVLQEGEEGMVVLDKTPFYAEKGGQVGDAGTLGDFIVTDCQAPYTGVIAHVGHLKKGSLKCGQTVKAAVEAHRRARITHNHTATHLLHWALQKVVGAHIKQAGSVVAPDRLRFDFNHHKALTKKEIREIEDLVNEKVRVNSPVQGYELSYADAQKREDIKQFFGDKYGDTVRVIDIEYSKELCGGTHTQATGDIGFFTIVEERSIASGVRRIVAMTGPEAIEYSRGAEDLLEEISVLLKTQPQKLLDRVNHLLEENTHYAHEIKQAQKREAAQIIEQLSSQVEKIGDITLVASEVSLEPKQLREVAEALLKQLKSALIILGSRTPQSASLVVRVSDDLIAKGHKAGDLIRELAPIIGGGGGGKADFAQAGGKQPAGLPDALLKARDLIRA